eukprot:15193518-Alexandrium_andersonii.AAC.1
MCIRDSSSSADLTAGACEHLSCLHPRNTWNFKPWRPPSRCGQTPAPCPRPPGAYNNEAVGGR